MARHSAADPRPAARPVPAVGVTRVVSQNATFQRWQSLLTNRTTRLRSGEFLVQGVRPITQAVAHGWPVRALLHDGRSVPSAWAAQLWDSLDVARYLVAPELMQLLGEKAAGTPELLAVAAMPADDFARIPVPPGLLVTVFDRPASPGNIGTLIRSVDAFGGTALIVTGHAADPYDPRCIRASTGSLFCVPVLRAASHREVLGWVGQVRADGLPVQVIGAEEDGREDLRAVDFRRPTVLVIGNEAAGLTAAWRAGCDALIGIPMVGSASSLNAATAGSIALYEAMRGRSPGSSRSS